MRWAPVWAAAVARDQTEAARDPGVMSTWYTGFYMNYITLKSGGALLVF